MSNILDPFVAFRITDLNRRVIAFNERKARLQMELLHDGARLEEEVNELRTWLSMTLDVDLDQLDIQGPQVEITNGITER